MIKYELISQRIAIYLIISNSRKEQTNLFKYSDIKEQNYGRQKYEIS